MVARRAMNISMAAWGHIDAVHASGAINSRVTAEKVLLLVVWCTVQNSGERELSKRRRSRSAIVFRATSPLPLQLNANQAQVNALNKNTRK